MARFKIVLLATEGASTRYLYHKLAPLFDIQRVIIENKLPIKKIIRRKIKTHGYVTTLGQLAFQALVPKVLQRVSRWRIKEITTSFQLSNDPIPPEIISPVESVNQPDTLLLIQEHQPDLIVVNGTRIISKKIIDAVHCPMLNIHAGITPKYRGVHGGYWALWNNDPQLCGVTVHFIDAGVDTGQIIAQQTLSPTKKDNFFTYPILQHAKGIELLIQAIHEIQNGNLKPFPLNVFESKQWYHPTLWGYLFSRIFRKIK